MDVSLLALSTRREKRLREKYDDCARVGSHGCQNRTILAAAEGVLAVQLAHQEQPRSLSLSTLEGRTCFLAVEAFFCKVKLSQSETPKSTIGTRQQAGYLIYIFYVGIVVSFWW